MGSELAKNELVDKAAELYMQGQKITNIAKTLGRDEKTIRNYLDEYEKSIRDRATADPEVLDRRLENSLRFLDNYDLLIMKAWDVHNKAEEADVASTQLSAIKQIDELVSKKARLMNLLGQNQENMYLEKAKRAEKVNTLLSDILRNIVSDCTRCQPLVWEELQRAFEMQGRNIEQEALPS